MQSRADGHTITLLIFGGVLLCKLLLCLLDQGLLALELGGVVSKLVRGGYGGLTVGAVDDTRCEGRPAHDLIEVESQFLELWV